MVLQEDHLRLGASGGFVSLNLVIDLLEKGIAGIAIRDIQGIGEQFLALSLCLLRAHKRVDCSGMQMYHECKAYGIVHGSLHRRAAVLGDAGSREVFFHLGLTLGNICTIDFCTHRIQLGTVQHGKSVFAYGGEGVAAGLYPETVGGLERCIAATGNHET